MTAILLLISGLMLLWLGIIWSSDRLLNSTIKTFLVLVGVMNVIQFMRIH